MQLESDFVVPEPLGQEAKRLKMNLSPERWEFVAQNGVYVADLIERVARHRETTGQSRRLSLGQIEPGFGWSRYLHCCRAEKSRSGPKWERQLDRRIPPEPEKIPEKVRAAAIVARLVNPNIGYEECRKILIRQFGEIGRISDTSLGRFWREEGLTSNSAETISETLEVFHGGAGLALIGAAATETQALSNLATVALEKAQISAQTQVDLQSIEARPDIAGRDSAGRFTAEYNRETRANTAPGQADCRWSSDAAKRAVRDLTLLDTLDHNPVTLASRMLAIGLVPLITEMRGFDGANTIRGGWLELAGIHAYKAATLDKTLSEMALLQVGEALWSEHGRQWREITLPWCEDGPGWLQFAFYIDATADPYWTSKYAASGPISRIGKVRPCLSRICITGGPGVPLLVETHAGAVSLKKSLTSMLQRIDELVGDEKLGRMTIVDAEIASVATLSALCETKRSFVTVLKGAAGRKAVLENPTNWVDYREKDRLREGFITLHGTGTPAEGLRLQAVEMERRGSRNPTPTLFVHNLNSPGTVLSDLYDFQAHTVADAYLSRWPNQEQLFRDARNGAGLERSHGYGGEYVSHIALETKLEKSERGAQRAEVKYEQAKSQSESLKAVRSQLSSSDSKASLDKAIRKNNQEVKAAEKSLEQARKKDAATKSTPDLIYQRDTTRENIVSALSLTVMMLLEFVLKEYFGGLKIELRTFVERFISLPVTVRKSSDRIVYQIHSNIRDRSTAEQLRHACAEITRRQLRRGGSLLVFELFEFSKTAAPSSA